MKTKSITSIAALLGAVAALNVSALAGPGPQPVPSKAKVSTIATSVHGQGLSAAQPAAEAVSKTFFVPGPRGTGYVAQR
jgi:hypothetical protein